MAGHSITTECAKCVFAIRDSNALQTGCEFNRLEKFQTVGTSVEQREGSYVILGRICMACRAAPWADGLTLEQKKQKVREEMRFACTAYVYVDDSSSLEDVRLTLDSLCRQTIPFKLVNIVNRSESMRKGQLVMLMREYDNRLAWFIRTIMERETEESIAADSATTKAVFPLVNRNRSLDIAIGADGSCPTPFYALFNAGYAVPSSFVADIDKAINEDLLEFVVLEGENDNGTVVLRRAHNQLAGNEEVELAKDEENAPDGTPTPPLLNTLSGIVNKVKYIAHNTNSKKAVKSVKEVCPSV